MEIKKIDTTTQKQTILATRPDNFDDFVGQSHIKKMLQTAITSAQKRSWPLWHILFSWPSGFWKTTMAHIIAQELWVNNKIITAYAITKPSEIVSILNALEPWDILFIDEIHRLKPNVEEVLYTAMEDFVVDMVMPEWWNIRIPINPFTLIWATTKPEMLSKPMKNRFVYSFHLVEYTDAEKSVIIQRSVYKGSWLLYRKVNQKSDFFRVVTILSARSDSWLRIDPITRKILGSSSSVW